MRGRKVASWHGDTPKGLDQPCRYEVGRGVARRVRTQESPWKPFFIRLLLLLAPAQAIGGFLQFSQDKRIPSAATAFHECGN